MTAEAAWPRRQPNRKASTAYARVERNKGRFVGDPMRLGRRQLLRGATAFGLGSAALAACTDPGSTSTPTPTPTATADPVAEAFAAAGIAGPQTRDVQFAGFELISGIEERVLFGLVEKADRSQVADASLVAYLISGDDRSVVIGPFSPTYHLIGIGEVGVYEFGAEVPTPGVFDLVVTDTDGANAGHGVVAVRSADQAAGPAPGDALPAVHTATAADPQNVAVLCTRDTDLDGTPDPCGMHELALDDALGAGTPLVLTIATPKFCQTAICGPVVDFVEEVRIASGREDLAWIHVEVFEDEAGQTLVELANVMALPSEPWVILADASGTIVDRFAGPTPPALLTEALSQL